MEQSASLLQLAFRKFRKNSWGFYSFVFICICVGVAIFAYVLAPDNSRNANQMHLSIHSKNPGFRVQMLTIPSEVTTQSYFDVLFFGDTSPDLQIPIYSYREVEQGIEIVEYTPDGSPGLVKTYSLELFPDVTSSEEIQTKYISDKTFWLGTDKYGRDLLSRILVGMRISLAIGFIAVLISLILGITLGRSEEHTSELQSRPHLVCRLLLEKKKNMT